MYQDQQGLPKQFYKEKSKEEEEADKRCFGRTTSKVDRDEVLRHPKKI